jgi:HK97 family phage major capsid protein
LLKPAQAQAFMRLLIKESVIMGMATVKPMRAPKELIEKIRFGSRVLRPGAEGVALPVTDRSKPDLSKVELDAKLFKAEVRLTDEVLEDSIERGDLQNTIMTILSEAVARDMDEVIINGDVGSPDLFLAQMDGIFAQIVTNTANFTDSVMTKTGLKAMVKLMPSEYLRDKRNMKILTSVDAETDYRDSIAARETVAGDKALIEESVALYNGYPIVPVPLFPENIGTSSHCTNAVLCNPKNINVGIWRNIKIESDRDISAGVLQIVASIRFDVKIAEQLACVKGYNIKVV